MEQLLYPPNCTVKVSFINKLGIQTIECHESKVYGNGYLIASSNMLSYGVWIGRILNLMTNTAKHFLFSVGMTYPHAVKSVKDSNVFECVGKKDHCF